MSSNEDLPESDSEKDALWPINIKTNGLFPPPGDAVGGKEFREGLRKILREKLSSGKESPETCLAIRRFLKFIDKD